MMGSAMAMLFLGGVGMLRFGLMVALAVGAVFVLVQTQEYRLQRLITFTDPWADQYGSGYQLTQALIAFGRGEWFGVGLGNSIQKQFYLPEAHTDFVFSVLAEAVSYTHLDVYKRQADHPQGVRAASEADRQAGLRR